MHHILTNNTTRTVNTFELGPFHDGASSHPSIPAHTSTDKCPYDRDLTSGVFNKETSNTHFCQFSDELVNSSKVIWKGAANVAS